MSDIENSGLPYQKKIIYTDDTCEMVVRTELSVSIEAAYTAVEEFARWCKNGVIMVYLWFLSAYNNWPQVHRGSDSVYVSGHYHIWKVDVGSRYWKNYAKTEQHEFVIKQLHFWENSAHVIKAFKILKEVKDVQLDFITKNHV